MMLRRRRRTSEKEEDENVGEQDVEDDTMEACGVLYGRLMMLRVRRWRSTMMLTKMDLRKV